MTVELTSQQVEQNIGKLKNLPLPADKLCNLCIPFGECAFRRSLVAAGNLGSQTTEYFNLLVNDSSSFKEECSFTVSLLAVATAKV